jgi:hypothetical protein
MSGSPETGGIPRVRFVGNGEYLLDYTAQGYKPELLRVCYFVTGSTRVWPAGLLAVFAAFLVVGFLLLGSAF